VTKHLFRCGAIFALAAGALLGFDWKTLKYEGYVSDFARVIDPQSKQSLEQYCLAVQNSTGAQIALVTIPSLQGEPVEDVANTIFHAWGVGTKGANDGIMLLLAIGERKSRLEVGYGLEPIVPDGFAGTILDDMRPALRQQHYGEAMLAAAQTIGSTIGKARGAAIPAQLHPRIRQQPLAFVSWPIILGVLFFVVWLIYVFRHFRGGWLHALALDNIMEHSTWGGRSGGGFGGYDSGDSFGGFGGGDSGGGGASSDW
jgi:uncharacterized protein